MAHNTRVFFKELYCSLWLCGVCDNQLFQNNQLTSINALTSPNALTNNSALTKTLIDRQQIVKSINCSKTIN